MRFGGGGSQPAEMSARKRRKFREVQEYNVHYYSKKRRLVAETETLTLASRSQTFDSLPGTSFSKPSHSSSRTRRKHKKHHGRKFSTKDGIRKWIYSSGDLSSYEDKVILVSYNILGVENASKHPDLYSNVSPKFLDWNLRKKLLYKEISQYCAGIVCLQEVDRFNDLDNLLQKDGFKGVYQARTGDACDGCAIFWKKELFTLLHQENIEFQRFDLRNNVAQFCVLEMNLKQSNPNLDTQTSQVSLSRRLLVGNIHVLFNPNRGDIKLGQIRLFLEKAHRLSQEWGNIPVVLAGDLNSIPQSALYQFIASSELDLQELDRRKMSCQICPVEHQGLQFQNSFQRSVSSPRRYRRNHEELRLATGAGGGTCLRHNLKLSSAYLGVNGGCGTRDNHGEPLATTYHSKFMGTVDYIWHTSELVPVKVLDTLPIEVLRKTGGLPSKEWGSDHLALVCELSFSDDCNAT
ncbi:carbon catabolite repressor protein 4 homolog 5 [Diospyros lotus]|uniref:carbon catabolite repressor protein 4 homolog 5 n=1 Tax=Diospyros lotus TaxID=55363 RepID=UPI002253F8D1|nr:carbon catabolite repressor protein 4 homolog 5 [Diospyros lotus]